MISSPAAFIPAQAAFIPAEAAFIPAPARVLQNMVLQPDPRSLQQSVPLTSPQYLSPSFPAYLLLDSIPTGPEAGELRTIGSNNIFDPRWTFIIQSIIEQNGGPGDVTTGYLAWSENGFVKFNNRTIPPELARRYAEISLVSGLEIEKLKITNEYDPDDIAGKIEFADKFEAAFQAFVQNPSVGFKVDGGGVIYTVSQNAEGGATFLRQKKPDWFHRFLNKALKWVKPVLSGLGSIFPSLKTVTQPLQWITRGAALIAGL